MEKSPIQWKCFFYIISLFISKLFTKEQEQEKEKEKEKEKDQEQEKDQFEEGDSEGEGKGKGDLEEKGLVNVT